MLAFYSGLCVSTVDTSLSIVRSPEFEVIIKKKFWTNIKKGFYTVQGSALVPLTLPFHFCDLQKSKYPKKTIWTKNENARTPFRVPCWYPLTPPFYLCDLNKSKYLRKILWTEK